MTDTCALTFNLLCVIIQLHFKRGKVIVLAIIPGLGWTFDTQATAYDRWRPTYVAALYRDIFEYMPLDGHSRALEIGSATGQATRPILDTGCHVTAVEPGANLAALAKHNFAGYPNFDVSVSKFEDCALPEGAFDLAYSASAFHWVPEQIGYENVFHALKPGGAFARFANHPYPAPEDATLNDDIQLAYARYMPGNELGLPYTAQAAQASAQLAAKYGFCDIEYHLYHRRRVFSASEYVALLSTYSDHIVLSEHDRSRFMREIEDAINRHGGYFALDDTIELGLARKPA